MAALRSLDPEFAAEIAAYQRRFTRLVRDNSRCTICGEPRDLCVCRDDRDDRTFSNDSDGCDA
jgi:hypothetical protein